MGTVFKGLSQWSVNWGGGWRHGLCICNITTAESAETKSQDIDWLELSSALHWLSWRSLWCFCVLIGWQLGVVAHTQSSLVNWFYNGWGSKKINKVEVKLHQYWNFCSLSLYSNDYMKYACFEKKVDILSHFIFFYAMARTKESSSLNKKERKTTN